MWGGLSWEDLLPLLPHRLAIPRAALQNTIELRKAMNTPAVLFKADFNVLVAAESQLTASRSFCFFPI
jgi:hypothetical protein